MHYLRQRNGELAVSNKVMVLGGGRGWSVAMPVSSAWYKLHLVKTPPSEALPLQPTLTYMDLYSASTIASNKMLNVPLYLQ